MSNADFKKNYWIKTLLNKVAYCRRNYKNQVKQIKVKQELLILRNEISSELEVNTILDFNFIDELYINLVSDNIFNETDKYLKTLKRYYLKNIIKQIALRINILTQCSPQRLKKSSFLS
jgi:hypothetical protein